MLSSGTSAPIEIVPRVVANTLVVMGILYFSTMLGLVVEAVQAKMQALREGKSVVVERGHSVMLGWTEKSLLFVKEIINANESEGGGVHRGAVQGRQGADGEGAEPVHQEG